MSVIRRIWSISRREVVAYSRRPLFLFCMVVAPVLCTMFFTTLMRSGLPTGLPAGIVDEDNTAISRTITRTIEAMEETDFKRSYASYSDARKAMQRGEIYAFFHIPEGTTEDAVANRCPRISFYTNESYLVPGSLLMKDLRTASELAGLALTRETLYARGATEDGAMGIIQPITIETHPIGNPTLDYGVYLNNILVPGIFILLIMLSTAYTIGMEWKTGNQKQLYAMSGNSPAGPFLFGLFTGQMRVAMCMCSLWGILSFSLAGFTYPVTAMDRPLQWMSWLFPLRHYYLIYVNQALDGHAITYVWPSVAAMLCFLLLPVLVLPRYRAAFLKYEYKP